MRVMCVMCLFAAFVPTGRGSQDCDVICLPHRIVDIGSLRSASLRIRSIAISGDGGRIGSCRDGTAVMWAAAITLMAAAISGSRLPGQARGSTRVSDRRTACWFRADRHHDLARPCSSLGMAIPPPQQTNTLFIFIRDCHWQCDPRDAPASPGRRRAPPASAGEAGPRPVLCHGHRTVPADRPTATPMAMRRRPGQRRGPMSTTCCPSHRPPRLPPVRAARPVTHRGARHRDVRVASSALRRSPVRP